MCSIKYRNIIKFTLLFVYFFFCLLLFYNLYRNDLYVNYGFSYAISRGEIAYNDFNIVVPLFSPFLYSIGLLFSKSIIVIYVEQSIFLCIMFYFLEKMLNNKIYLFLLCMILPYPLKFASILFPGYNFISFLFIIVLIYLEENKKDDFIIGIVLGLLIITKQNIGVMLFLPMFYYLFKDIKKFIRRLLGFIIPTVLFLLYLILSGSFYNFINLCILGLTDFSSNNDISLFYFIIMIIGFIYVFYKFIIDKNIIYIYVMLYIIVCFPLIDYYHVSYFILMVIFIMLYKSNVDVKDNIVKYICILCVSISFLFLYVECIYLINPIIKSYNNFEYSFVSKEYDKDIDTIYKYLNGSKKRVIYLLRGSENYFFKIMNNKKIDYFDLTNYGNYGYRGVNKIINMIKKEHDCLLLLDSTLYDKQDGQQYIVEIAEYVRDNSSKIESFGIYDLYYKK